MPTVQGMTLACIRVNVIAIRCHGSLLQQADVDALMTVPVGGGVLP